ncbi:MAG TPA: hypothetical protein P5038_18440 [Candidatus Paceibacterota bacterium]|nr:hypothetical protein [Candidatus Paceibacterota bacterium]
MISFTESGMIFGPYAETDFFGIEKCATYGAIQDGVKMAEFLLIRETPQKPPCVCCVWIVEAKSSSPQPKTQPEFDGYIADIKDKLTNGLSLCFASVLKRHPNTLAEWPDKYRDLELSTAGFRLVLVINGHQLDWLPPLQDALRRALHPTAKTWALDPNAVVVLNHEGARQFGLTSAP